MPELESPYSGSELLPAPVASPGRDRSLARNIPRVDPAPEQLGLCLWLNASRSESLKGVAEALWARLGGTSSEVEILSSEDGDGRSTASEGGSHGPIVAALAHAASALVRRGVFVVVACPLGPRERAQAHELTGRMVEIFLRTSPKEIPLDRIPVIYRTLENGKVREHEIVPTLDTPSRPDVVLEGNSRTPSETAVDILDALARAGWFSHPGVPSPALRALPV